MRDPQHLRPRHRAPLHAALAAALLALGAVACTGDRGKHEPAPAPLATLSLPSPESVVFDSARGVYYVSVVNGDPGVRPGKGFIARVTADGALDSLHFIQGGRGGVALDAPMGSRVHADTLWVLDVDKLRGFALPAGTPAATIDFAPLGALFLNDVAIGGDGAFYVTDTGVRVSTGGAGPNRIYRVGPDRVPQVALESSALASPDGIDWDPEGERFILAPFGGRAVQSWRPGDSAPADIAPGRGKFDGVEVGRDGQILVTSWNDSSVATLDGDRLAPRVAGLPFPPADVSRDERRGRIGVVSLTANRFELRAWPPTR
jgi:sugar lactone lactonase YvrE